MKNTGSFKRGSEHAREAGRKGGHVRAAQRRQETGPYEGTILDVMDAAGLTSPSWFPWRVFLKAVFTLPMDDAELEFPYDRLTRFKDIEGAGRVVANPKSLRKRYLARIREFTGRLKSDCFKHRISYMLANTKEPYDQFLAAYLDKRSRIG